MSVDLKSKASIFKAESKTRIIHTRFTESVHRQLSIIANFEGCGLADLIRKIVNTYLVEVNKNET